jgi:hypothetical protein
MAPSVGVQIPSEFAIKTVLRMVKLDKICQVLDSRDLAVADGGPGVISWSRTRRDLAPLIYSHRASGRWKVKISREHGLGSCPLMMPVLS